MPVVPLKLFSLAAGISARPATKSELQNFSIPRSHSLSWRLGRAVVRARAAGTISTVEQDLIEEFGGLQSARKIFEGKIVGIGQSIRKGHSHGTLIIDKLKDYEKEGHQRVESDGPERVVVPFINENLVVNAFYASGEEKVRPVIMFQMVFGSQANA